MIPHQRRTTSPDHSKRQGVPRKPSAPLVGRQGWLDAAREALLKEGIVGVEVGKLARSLGVTRGGFYWFFKTRAQLCDELLANWERASTVQFAGLLTPRGRNGMREFRALVNLWVDEKDYDPAWDAAIRDWARTSHTVARVVHRVDDKRISVLRRIFCDLGYRRREALVRARITYYHQIGYYALGVLESKKQRRGLLPLYVRVLTGGGGEPPCLRRPPP